MDVSKSSSPVHLENTVVLKTKPYVLRALYKYREKGKSENPEKFKQQNQAIYQKRKERLQADHDYNTKYREYVNVKSQEYRIRTKVAHQESRSTIDLGLLEGTIDKFTVQDTDKDSLRTQVIQFLAAITTIPSGFSAVMIWDPVHM